MNKNIKYSQNFLTSEKVLNQIIKQLNLKETDTVYEKGKNKNYRQEQWAFAQILCVILKQFRK